MKYSFIPLAWNCIGECRMCSLESSPTNFQATENQEITRKADTKETHEIHAESLSVDLQQTTGQKIKQAQEGLKVFTDMMTNFDKRMDEFRQKKPNPQESQSLPAERIDQMLNSLPPAQRDFMKIATMEWPPTHQEAFVTLSSKLPADMRQHLLQEKAVLSINDFRQIGNIIPSLNRQELDILMLMPVTLHPEVENILSGTELNSAQEKPLEKTQRSPAQQSNNEAMSSSGKAVGITTDAAMRILDREFLDYGLGTNIISKFLNISGETTFDTFTVFTAIGNTLYAEFIGADGTAQKFAIPMGKGEGERMRASLKTMNGKSQAGVQEGFKKFEPIATYHTTKVETIYHKKPVDRINVLGIYECDIVKTAGKLPELYRQADKSNILIERTGSGMHSPMVAKIDGRIVAMTTKGFEDRDEWEKGIEKMLEEALKMVQEKKKAR